MKALTFQGIEEIAYDSVPDPRPEAPGDAIVRVEIAGLCGSDLHVYHGRERGLDAGTVLGHELVGEVVEVGSGVRAFRVGDPVVSPFTTSCGGCFYCRRGLTARCEQGQLFGWVEGGEGLHGAQAELVRVPLADSTLVRVPDGAPAEEALFAGDILATGLFAADLAAVEAGSTVAVVGCGPVGMMAVLAAREAGAATVYAIDSLPERLGLVERLGAQGLDFTQADAVAELRAATEGRGADSVLEAVGSPEATRLAADLVRPGGTIAAVGVHTEEQLAFSPLEAYDKNLSYRAGRCPARHYMERALAIVEQGKYDLASLISHRLPLAEGVHAYDLFARRAEGCTKVILRP